MQIYETKNFIVESFKTPHVDRNEGGHIKIYPKNGLKDRTEMSPSMAFEYIRLTMIVGKAMETAMTRQGLEITRINYHDMGNWAYKKGQQPKFHLHIYGRDKNAKKQPYQEAVYLPDRSTGFYEGFKPLDGEDVKEIKKEIANIEKEDKYIKMQQIIDSIR
jgi:diadenosine tetraphosphate (Ap4A) HIT family hydrolase